MSHPTNARELFNLRHSSLRLAVERAFGALKGRFRILDNKPFHTYKTQVKLVLACCILHNWIVGYGIDSVVPTEAEVVSNPLEEDEPLADLSLDEPDMTIKRDAICNAMWAARGTSRT
jgi:hypothetical protein